MNRRGWLKKCFGTAIAATILPKLEIPDSPKGISHTEAMKELNRRYGNLRINSFSGNCVTGYATFTTIGINGPV
jgi:hypothetical protein